MEIDKWVYIMFKCGLYYGLLLKHLRTLDLNEDKVQTTAVKEKHLDFF